MKVSELTQDIILNHLREIRDNLSTEDMVLISAMKEAAIGYVVGQTGLKKEEIDNYEDITIAVLDLISDMWDNRSMTIDRANLNIVADTILYMHSRNLLPTPEGEEV